MTNETTKEMTREEASQIIEDWLKTGRSYQKEQVGYIEGWFYEKDVEAFNMAIEELQDNCDWTQVEDGLPKKRGFYNVTIEDEYGRRWTEAVRWNGRDDCENDVYSFDVAPIVGKVIAWKPLPAPYEVKE